MSSNKDYENKKEELYISNPKVYKILLNIFLHKWNITNDPRNYYNSMDLALLENKLLAHGLNGQLKSDFLRCYYSIRRID